MSWPFAIVLVLAVMLVGSELWVRGQLGAPLPERLPLLRVQPDPELAYRPVAGDLHYAFDQLVQLNSQGLRGPDLSPKTDDGYRIVVVGNSQVYGPGISDEELLTRVLERKLNNVAPQRIWRAINLGVRGYALNQQLRLLELLQGQLQADHVVLFIYMYSYWPRRIAEHYQRHKDYDWYMLDLDGKPSGKALWRWHLTQTARSSALVVWLHDLYKRYRLRGDLIDRLLKGERSEQVDTALRYVRGELERLRLWAVESDVRVSIAVLPAPQQLGVAYPDELYQSELARMAATLEMDFIDLRPPLEELYRNSGSTPVQPFTAHYDTTAHQHVGLFLVEHLSGIL